MRVDLAIAFKACGPRLLTPHPTYGERIFVIAAESTTLPEGMCASRGSVRRSALKETLGEKELTELLNILRSEGYLHIKKVSTGGSKKTGRWTTFSVKYYAGNSK